MLKASQWSCHDTYSAFVCWCTKDEITRMENVECGSQLSVGRGWSNFFPLNARRLTDCSSDKILKQHSLRIQGQLVWHDTLIHKLDSSKRLLIVKTHKLSLSGGSKISLFLVSSGD